MNAFVSKATRVNPKPANKQAKDVAPVGDSIDAERGYGVLDRADPTSYDRGRRGLAPPVRNYPNIAYDEE